MGKGSEDKRTSSRFDCFFRVSERECAGETLDMGGGCLWGTGEEERSTADGCVGTGIRDMQARREPAVLIMTVNVSARLACIVLFIKNKKIIKKYEAIDKSDRRVYSLLGSITLPPHLIVTSLALPHTVFATGGTAGLSNVVEMRPSAYPTASRVNADWKYRWRKKCA